MSLDVFDKGCFRCLGPRDQAIASYDTQPTMLTLEPFSDYMLLHEVEDVSLFDIENPVRLPLENVREEIQNDVIEIVDFDKEHVVAEPIELVNLNLDDSIGEEIKKRFEIIEKSNVEEELEIVPLTQKTIDEPIGGKTTPVEPNL